MLCPLSVFLSVAVAATGASNVDVDVDVDVDVKPDGGGGGGDVDVKSNDGVARALAVFDLWLEDKARREAVPSFSVAVVHDQELIWAKALGYADVERKVRATPQTQYRIASLTKTFTAAAVMQLRDDGKLSLDDPVQKHVPWAPAGITVRQLLTHTSGLSRDPPGDHWDTMRFAPSTSLRELVAQQPPSFAPGERFKYSNIGYAIAGELVASLAKRPWRDVVTERLLAPLEMSSTSADAAQAAARNVALAVAYGPLDRSGRRPVVRLDSLGWLAPASAMSSSAEDLARWVSFQLRTEPRPLAPLALRTVREMHRPQAVRGDIKAAWGLGWAVVPVERDRPRVVHGGGADRGFRSLVTFDPAKRIGFVVLTNSDSAPRDVAEQLWKIVAPAITKAAAAPVDRARVASLSRYVGRYQSAFFAGEPLLVVVDTDGTLVVVEGDGDDPWGHRAVLRDVSASEGAHAFRFDGGDADGDPVRFEVGKDGKIVRVVGLGWSARKIPD